MQTCESGAGLMLDDGLTDISAVIALFVLSEGRVGQGFPAGFTIHPLDQLFPPGFQHAARSLSNFSHAEALFRLVAKTGTDGVEPFQLVALSGQRAGFGLVIVP